jgi:hypothetical protein
MESDSAWAGFGAEYLEAIRGEYPKTSIWTWGIESQKVRTPFGDAINCRRMPSKSLPSHE